MSSTEADTKDHPIFATVYDVLNRTGEGTPHGVVRREKSIPDSAHRTLLPMCKSVPENKTVNKREENGANNAVIGAASRRRVGLSTPICDPDVQDRVVLAHGKSKSERPEQCSCSEFPPPLDESGFASQIVQPLCGKDLREPVFDN